MCGDLQEDVELEQGRGGTESEMARCEKFLGVGIDRTQ